MASPTQDDSLVFAADSRWTKQPNSSSLPRNPDFSPDSHHPNEPTQLDQSTSPVFRSASFSSSDERDLLITVASPPSQPNFRKFGSDSADLHAGDEVHDVTAEDGVDLDTDTQVIGKRHDYGGELAPTDDTQVILPRRHGETGPFSRTTESNRPASPTPHNDANNGDKHKNSEDTQAQIDDTHLNLTNGDLKLQFLASDTQVITTSSTTANPGRITAIDDTQVIQSERLTDTSALPATIEALAEQTHADTPNSTVLDQKSPTLIWKDTQPITQLPDLQPDTLPLSQVQSSPNKNFELDTTLLLSPSRPVDEPTTQVLNTQEELIDDEHISVDLGHKPVLSSGQTDSKLRSDLSIISNDDDLRDHDNHIMYEDSVFQHRKRRKLVQGEVEADLSDASMCDGEEEQEKLPEDTLKVDTTTVNGQSKDIGSGSLESLPKTQDDTQKEALNEPPSESPHDIAVSDSPKLYSSSTVTHKTAWSQSSSELEDVSHTVQDLDINALTGNDDDTNDVILVPRPRRRTEIPPTQSQNAELREETLANQEMASVKNEKAVWAFSLFKHYPARVLDYGEGTSFIEFADLTQIEVKNTDLFLLDLRLGDVVHLVLSMGEYIVTGLALFNHESPFKCIRGYDTVYIGKKGRHGVAQGAEMAVLLSEIYMEVGEWASHQQRYHIFHDEFDLVQENYGVVKSVLGSTNGAEIPPASRTTTVLSPKKLNLDAGKPLRSSLFVGFVFFVTSIDDARKNHLSEMITTNGGVFIDDDIKQHTELVGGADGLRLALSKFGNFHFGALLSDGYSRSAKYLQALALGWPILADCYIEHVIGNPDMLHNWLVYLLPAGHSLVTNGVRSLEVYDFRNNFMRDIGLNGQLGLNLHLLAAHNVVVLNKKQSAKTLDMCEFIFHAFGSKSLSLCLSVGEINEVVLKLGPNILIYDNAASEYANSRKTTKKAKSKGKVAVGIIDWEWVVQCVISGYVWRPASEVTI